MKIIFDLNNEAVLFSTPPQILCGEKFLDLFLDLWPQHIFLQIGFMAGLILQNCVIPGAPLSNCLQLGP